MTLRNDRRRRVLADELLISSDTDSLPTGAEPLPAASGLRYARAACRENQPRLIDFVPVRALPLLLCFGAGLALISAVLAAFYWLPTMSRYAPIEGLASFDLASKHNIASWFASLLLLSNTQLALLVYSVRKHRVDDYHGRYRVWLAMALISVLASLDLTTGIHRLIGIALAPLRAWCGIADHYGLWAFLGTVSLYLSIRLVLETKRSKLALLAYLLSAGAFGCLLIPVENLVSLETPAQTVMLSTGLNLLGCLLLLTGTLLYARHVMLDVEGKIPEKKRKKPKPAKVKRADGEKPRRSKDSAADGETKRKIDGPEKLRPHIGVRTDLDSPPRPKPVPKPTFVPKSNPPETLAEEDEDSEDSNDLRNLSRIDRKRLKREAKLARRAQAA